ncbi:MAG: dimethylsulfonioproprionate lyase family protein [Pseudomonadota bacterium]
MSMNNTLANLLASTHTAFGNARLNFGAPVDAIDEALAGLDSLDADAAASKRPSKAHVAFVTRHMNDGGTQHGDANRLRQDITASADQLPWMSSFYPEDGYADIGRFYDGYAFAMAAGDPVYGDESVWQSREVGLSYTVQAPHTLYPEHAHTAVELYYVVSGKALWKRGSEPWVARYPGDIILHETGMRHAMMTGDEPLVACAIWISHTQSRVVIVRS